MPGRLGRPGTGGLTDQLVLAVDGVYRNAAQLQISHAPRVVQVHAIHQILQVVVLLRVEQALSEVLEFGIRDAAVAALAFVWIAVNGGLGGWDDEQGEDGPLQLEERVGVDEWSSPLRTARLARRIPNARGQIHQHSALSISRTPYSCDFANTVLHQRLFSCGTGRNSSPLQCLDDVERL